MRSAAALFSLLVFGISAQSPAVGQGQKAPPSEESNDTYLTIHNVGAAHEITLGAGTRVGILDRSFEIGAHPELYAGAVGFLAEEADPPQGENTHHGYWMALALHEIAPDAEIYALEAYTENEDARVEAVIRALDWAVGHDLDVVTYCVGAFSAEAQVILDPVVERTVAAGVVVVFVDYPHPLNLLPAGFGPRAEEATRDPDLNIVGYDCTTLLADRFIALMDPDDDGIQKHRPFLARASTGPVTAGLVALLRSVDRQASPSLVKRVLMETSRPMVYRGRLAARVPDAFAAIMNVVGVSPGAPAGM